MLHLHCFDQQASAAKGFQTLRNSEPFCEALSWIHLKLWKALFLLSLFRA